MRGPTERPGLWVRVVLSVLSRLLPRSARSEWIEAWKGEFTTAADHSTRPHLLVHGAWLDAWESRRLADELAIVRGQAQGGTDSGPAFARELRLGARSLLKRPGFAATAIATIGLGVGTSTAMFGAIHTVLLRPLPYPDAERVVVIRQTDTSDGTIRPGASAANVTDIGASASTLRDVAFADGVHGLKLLADGRASSLRAWVVSAGFFEALGAPLRLGRALQADDFRAGSEAVVVLSEPSWRTRFGADPHILERTVVLDGMAHVVVGVLAGTFQYPSAADAYVPRPPQPWDPEERGRANMDAVARLSPGVALADAESELRRIASELQATFPDANPDLGFELTPLDAYLLGDARSPLLLLLAAVGLLLLISAANLAGLQVARSASRSREYAVRRSLGATSGDLIAAAAAESTLLAILGGAAGVGTAFLGVGLLRSYAPDNLPRIDGITVDLWALGFAALATMVCCVSAGILLALRATKVEPQAALSIGSRGTTGGREAIGARDRLVIGQVATALVLGVGAGLLLRSADQLLDNALGFEPEGRLALQVWAYNEAHEAELEFFDRAVERLKAIPGVASVGLTSDLPLANNELLLTPGRRTRFAIGSEPIDPSGAPEALLVGIDEGFVEAIGLPVVEGRSFSPEDTPGGLPVALVNEAFARRHVSGRSPVGEQLALARDRGATREIVGVLGDVRRRGRESEPVPEIYVPLQQVPANGLVFVLKTGVSPESLVTTVRDALWEVDPSQAIWANRPLTELLGDWTRQRRFSTVTLTAFAAIALLLAGIGIYGLITFSVQQMLGELGIRRALGGSTGHVVGLVLRRVGSLAVTGIAVGLAASLLLTRFLQGMLFGVSPLDPRTFITLSVVVGAACLVASAGPIRRAARVEPVVALAPYE